MASPLDSNHKTVLDKKRRATLVGQKLYKSLNRKADRLRRKDETTAPGGTTARESG